MLRIARTEIAEVELWDTIYHGRVCSRLYRTRNSMYTKCLLTDCSLKPLSQCNERAANFEFRRGFSWAAYSFDTDPNNVDFASSFWIINSCCIAPRATRLLRPTECQVVWNVNVWDFWQRAASTDLYFCRAGEKTGDRIQFKRAFFRSNYFFRLCSNFGRFNSHFGLIRPGVIKLRLKSNFIVNHFPNVEFPSIRPRPTTPKPC